MCRLSQNHMALSWYLLIIILAILFIVSQSEEISFNGVYCTFYFYVSQKHSNCIHIRKQMIFSQRIDYCRIVEPWYIPNVILVILFRKFLRQKKFVLMTFIRHFSSSHLVGVDRLCLVVSLLLAILLRWSVLMMKSKIDPHVWTNTYLSQLSQQLPKLSAGIKTALSLPGQLSAPSICTVPQQGRLFVLLLNCFLLPNHPFIPATVPLPFW